MPSVVRFVLSTTRDLYVAGVGDFIDGVLDVDANNLKLVSQTRYLVTPYGATEIGIVDSATPPPSLPAVPGRPNPDPYPQYPTIDEIVVSPEVHAAAVAAVENATSVAPAGAWDFTNTTVTGIDSTGAVDSVNGQTGAVVLGAADVGAQPAGSYAAAVHQHPASDVTGFIEAVQDAVATFLVAGTGVTKTYADDSNTLTLAVTATTDLSGVEGIKVHDGTPGGGVRPTGYARVRWVGGAARPTNMVAGDVWERPV